ncbi:MAG: AmmeMemoRadiSam system radical SAM enzyme [Planctomycetes bacterium]|nr:AmmeMemoRadiSam system radical SAM enzyme [Planctomycetota bacterium]
MADGERRAILWEREEGDAVRCALCAHRCRVAPGRRGFCSVRENRDGELFTLVYGKLIACHVDPIEKKPLYHVLPGTTSLSIATAGCNFRCAFCQNHDISQAPRRGGIPGSMADPQELVATARREGCASIAYTYTEPTIFLEFALDVAARAKREGLRNVFVTNGYQTEEAIEAMAGLIDAANIDLKGWSDAFYRTWCQARLDPVKAAIRRMHEEGIRVEVTTLVIPEHNDSDEDLRGIATFLAEISPDIPWHVSRFHPDNEMVDVDSTPIETILRAVRIAREAGLRYVYPGNVPGSRLEDTVCPSCGTKVIERRGFAVLEMRLDGSRCASCGAALPILI